MIRPLKQLLIHLTISYSNLLRNVTLKFINNIPSIVFHAKIFQKVNIFMCKINL